MNITEKELRAYLPKFELVDPKKIRLNPNNPRTITEKQFNRLVKSIESFWQMLFLRPIVLDDDMALGGNQRTLAARKAGLPLVPVIRAENLTEQQKTEFILKDNINAGEWDMDKLANEWDENLLRDWGFSVPSFGPIPSSFTPGITDGSGDDIGNEVRTRNRRQDPTPTPPVETFNLLVKCQDQPARDVLVAYLEEKGFTPGEDFYFV